MNPGQIYHHCRKLIDGGKFDQAKRDLYERFIVDPTDSNILALLARMYRLTGDNMMGYYMAKMAQRNNKNRSNHVDIDDELSICSYYVGHKDDGYDASDRLLLSSWTERYRQMAYQRLVFYVKPLSVKEKLTIDIDDIPTNFVPSSPSIIKTGDGVWKCNLRVVNYGIRDDGTYYSRDSDGIVRTRNYLLDIMFMTGDGHTDLTIINRHELVERHPLAHKYPTHVQGCEDVRLLGRHLLTCNSREVYNNPSPQMCLCKYNDDGDMTDLIPMILSVKDVHCEKNWLGYVEESSDAIMFIYRMDPLTIYMIDMTGTKVKEYVSTTRRPGLGSFRGSGGPIPFDNGYLMTIHQVHFNGSRRNYFHRFMWIDSSFERVKISRLFYFDHIGVEYTLSLCQGYNSDTLFIGYSVNDSCAKICVVDSDYVRSILSDYDF